MWLGHKRHHNDLKLSLRLFTQGKANCYVMRTLKQPMERSCDEAWGLLSTASTNLPGKWGATLEANSAAPVKPSDDCSLANILTEAHKKPWARTVQWRHPWIPDPQKLCEIIHVYCFNPLNFGVICYTDVDCNTIPPSSFSILCHCSCHLPHHCSLIIHLPVPLPLPFRI